LIAAARIFSIPIIVSEQYPKGLGHTQAEVLAELPENRQLVEKMTMSCCGNPDFPRLLAELRRWQIVVCGIEAHACVSQTVHELLERGFQVHLPWDAISARFTRDADVAWEKMIGSGAVPSSTEMICLEWVRSADSPEFKAVHKLIK
jgi:nicotinamidase-related amidase